MLFLLPLLLLLTLPPSLAQCPTNQCSCVNEVQGLTLNCRGQGLSAVPEFDDTSFEFYEVTLSDNQITSLWAGGFKTSSGVGLDTQVLDLTENPVTYIDAAAFGGLDVTVLKLHVSGMTTFPSSALSSLKRLTHLTLRGFSLPRLPPAALSPMPHLHTLSMQACGLEELSATDFTSQVDSLQEVDLSSNSLSAVPTAGLSVLTGLRLLKLTGNAIREVGEGAFGGMGGLEEVNLEQNGITGMSAGAFRGVEEGMRRLYLGNNKPGLVAGDLVAVQALYNLEELDLSYNTLSSLPLNFFSNMQRLATLNLQNNAFTSLSAPLFRGLDSSLTELNVMENQIASLPDGTFAELKALRTLRLDRNPLGGAFSMNTFEGLETGLTHLYLMDTEFTEAHWLALWGLHSLQSLDLEDNSISEVADHTFKHYTSLSLLNLRKNQLTSLSQRGLRGLHTSLQRLILDNNAIQTLTPCVVHEFQQLQEIQLRSNPLDCDCRAVWLHEWVMDHNPATNLWVCATPAQHAGRYLKDLGVGELTCDSPPPEEECEEFTTTTSSTAPAPTMEGTGAPGPVYPLHLNVTEVTPSSLRVVWRALSAGGVTGWQVTCSVLDTGEQVYTEQHGAATRDAQIASLTPSTHYFLCVVPQGGGLDQACIDEVTAPEVGASISPTQKTLIILGAVMGLVLVIALIIALACFLRWRNRNAHPTFKQPTLESHSNPELPQVSDQSKRFSKAKSHSLGNLNGASNMDLDRRLDGFSPDERNRILALFSNTGASTLSMLSTASQRYTHEPGRPGYLNPTQVSQELGRQDSGEYQEIPADTYDQIPLEAHGDTYNQPDVYNQPYEERPKSTGDILGGASNYI